MNASAQSRPTNPLKEALLRVQTRLRTHPDEARTLDEAAVLLYQAGKTEAASDFARRAARAAPKDPFVHDHLALILREAGQVAEAVAAGKRATALAPREASFWVNLGNAQMADAKPRDAALSLDRAATLAPRDALVRFNLGNAHAAVGESAKAIASFEKAIALDASLAPARRNLALLLREAGRSAEAAAVLSPLAESQDPDLLHLLGNVRLEAGDPAAALTSLRAAASLGPDIPAIRLDLVRCLVRLDLKNEALPLCEQLSRRLPENPAVWNLLGLCTQVSETATAHFRRALELQPGFADAAINLARRIVDDGEPAAALPLLDAALAHSPDNPELAYTRGVALLQLDRGQEALEANAMAIARRPDYANAHWNSALCHLRLGRYAAGWAGYEWRWRHDTAERLRFTNLPLWPASSPRDGHLLVWSEQGVGDEVMFATLLPALQPLVDRVTVTCCPRLVALFTRSFPDFAFVAQDPDRRTPDPTVAADWQIPAGSLPGRFWTESGPPPCRRPVLRADPAQANRLRASYKTDDRPVIGIAWRTSNAKNGRARSIAPSLWAPLLRTLPARFISLQYGDTSGELAEAATAGLEVLQDPAVDQMRDLDAFAAQIAALDAVLTIDNSTAHFAGALDRPTWVLLPTPADWRWRSHGSTTPWYRSVRLHRRAGGESWTEPLARAIGEIAAAADPNHPAASSL